MQGSTQLVIEAIEDDLARLELQDGRELLLLRSWLPPEAIEGHHLTVEADELGGLRFVINLEATEAARRFNQTLLDELNKTDSGKDTKL